MSIITSLLRANVNNAMAIIRSDKCMQVAMCAKDYHSPTSKQTVYESKSPILIRQSVSLFISSNKYSCQYFILSL